MRIRHEAAEQRFVAENGAHHGVLEYETLENGSLEYKHTFVLEASRGQGIGSRLVRHALDYALERDLSVVPTCPFVATVMASEPRYRVLRAARAERREEQDGNRRLRYVMGAGA